VKQSTFVITKMDCPTEEQLIRNRLRGVPGIDRLAFDLVQRELTVDHLPGGEGTILAALSSIGMDPVLKDGLPEDETGDGRVEAGSMRERRPLLSRAAWGLIGLSGALAAAAEVVAWTSGREDSWPVVTLAVLSMVLGGREMLLKGWRALRTFTLNINFLMTLAIAGAVGIGQWPEAAMVTFLFALAEIIEGYSLDRARGAIRGLMALTPETAYVGVDGAWREVRAAAVRVGQRVRVRPGERIPLDGVVVAGASTVNQAPITGESMPVEKREGDAVFAGTINERGTLDFEVTAAGRNTTLARIIRAVQQAQAEKAPTQRFVDRFARVYTPVVVVLAVLVAVLPPLVFGAAFYPWFYRALVLLVIACPCALVISTPVTVVSGLAAAARRGVLVKGGRYLEEGRRLRVIALDKTGTLTYGRPVVTDVLPLVPGRSEGALLHLAANLDAPSEHPVASAIVAAWTGTGGVDAANPAADLLPVTGFSAIPGRGVQGRLGGTRYYVGNHRLAHERGVCTPAAEAALERLEAEGKTAVVLMTDHEVLAALGVADTVRPTSREAIRALHDLGLRTVLLTGDNQHTADAIARQVGIDDARGALLPEEKLAALDGLVQTYGAAGMVGDGINDAPALARASIGFAMGAAGTDIALETADVALMDDDLRKLPAFVRLSRKTARVLAQNIALAIGIKVVFFALALSGAATLWMAVFADMGGSLLVTFNGLRLLATGPHEAPPEERGATAPGRP
jgi:Cd2+/Zn2+-exporting ATPase